jgi:hypothetical protein
MENPFSLGLVKDADQFCNRKKEIQELLRHARNSHKVVLYSPRRYGKSSLVSVVQNRLLAEKIPCVYADLFPISSKKDLIFRLSSAFLKGLGRNADPRSFLAKIGGFFGRLRPTMEMNAEGVSFSVDVDRQEKADTLLDDLMEGVERYSEKKKIKISVALDEFQEIMELPESREIEGILRSHIQRHRHISYFFVGSRRRILQDMFTLKNRPFYKSAFLYPLGKIAREEFVPYIKKRFEDGGKSCPATFAEKIFDGVDGYPYYVQKAASIVWDQTSGEVTEEVVLKSEAVLLQVEGPDFEAHWSGLTLGQKSLLKALANTPTSTPYSAEYLKRFGLSLGGTQKSLKVLLERDLIEKTDSEYRLTDPVMKKWLFRF